MGDKKEEKNGSEDDDYFFADIGDEEIEDWVSDGEYDEDIDLDDLEDKPEEKEVKEPVPAAVEKKEKEPVQTPKTGDQQPVPTESKGKDAVAAGTPPVTTVASAKAAEPSIAVEEEPLTEEEEGAEPDMEVDLRSPKPAAAQDEAVEEGMSEEADTDEIEGGETQQ
eukprot:3827713-Pyramimonas_sp.AAC.1